MIAQARSFLFVPGSSPARFAKALASGADAVIIDLEDAVPLADKSAARAAVQDFWPSLTTEQRARLLVRVNPAQSEFFAQDLTLMQTLKPAGIVLAKAERAQDLQRLASAVGPQVALLPLVESAAGYAAVDELAAAPQVCRLAFGNIDFQADLGMACGADEAELQPVRFGLVLASRLAGIAPPVDGVTLQTDDPQRLATDVRRALRNGFAAKLCIHPRQVEAVHQALKPSADELDWARRVVDASSAADGGAVQLDGKMIDRPVLLLAQRKLAMAQRQK